MQIICVNLNRISLLPSLALRLEPYVSLPHYLPLYVLLNVLLPISITNYQLNDNVVINLFATYLVYIVRL